MVAIADLYGSDVFDEHTMQERLPSTTYKSLLKTLKDGEPLDLEVANVVAHAMKEWAIEKGATHFTHWFQPLSGITSEKHDSFIDPVGNGRAIMSFSGNELIQGEPDASSFPSGGLRASFEARGYTAWDPTSYAFIKDGVLCIPTAFCSYAGEALDKKTPLLRSMGAVEREGKRVLALFGDHPHRIVPMVGLEQEYFLIPEREFNRRKDLVITGRTLFGYRPCKGQELEEHYFGAIHPTVSAFMKDLNEELWKLGVPAKTEHNEAAPAQHELVPIFTNANRAIDENLLVMEKMRQLAPRHGLVCLQHEKPFRGINGSGKHNNWSLVADRMNLFDPGETPIDNLRFLVFLSCVIEAVDEYQDLLRLSAASAGNDHRLGSHEAPPAIVSMFLGDDLDGLVQAIIEDNHEFTSANKVAMSLGADVLPNLLQDNTDRNRTSPFAFTGNKFEFRMPGSSQNVADCNTILNTAMAKSLHDFADAMEGKQGEAFEQSALEYVRTMLMDHRRIIFNGNGYAQQWQEQAQGLGLSNYPTTADALPCLITEKSISLFAEMGVLSPIEVRSRYEVNVEKYNKTMNIEVRTMKRLARRSILPAVNRYIADVAAGIERVQAVDTMGKLHQQKNLLRTLLDKADAIGQQLEALEALHEEALDLLDGQERANCYAHRIVPVMELLRAAVDEAEKYVGEDYWPMPTYNEVLFTM